MLTLNVYLLNEQLSMTVYLFQIPASVVLECYEIGIKWSRMLLINKYLHDLSLNTKSSKLNNSLLQYISLHHSQ